MPLSALTEPAQAPIWPDQRVDRESQEGDQITIGFRATAPEGQTVTYAATGLPPGLSIDPITGVVSGTLPISEPGTVNTGGAAGVHTNVTITATSSSGASANYVFDWRVSRFRKGDVFAGIGGGRYRVFSDQGEFKYELTVDREEDFIDYTGNNYGWFGGTTTGCGYNWNTRRMYFTAFDDDYDPSVAEVDPVPVGGQIVRTNRISTFRDAGIERGGTATGIPIDSGPESVVFGTDFGPDGALGTLDDIPGAMYVGHALGYYTPAPKNVDPDSFAEINGDINDNAIIATEDWSFFYYVDADGNPILDNEGKRIPYTQGFSMDGYLEKSPGVRWLDSNNNPIKALVQYGRDIQKWLPGPGGTWTRAVPDPDTAPLVEGYDTHAGWQGSDWLDLASDQRTMFYTSEWGVVYRYDVGPNPVDGIRQRMVPPANPDDYPVKNWPYVTLEGTPSRVLYALRLLPPGDGSGGLLVATPPTILRINRDGVIVQHYDAPNIDGWFALNIAPDGKSFWSASTSTGRIYRWDIASAALVNLAAAGVQGIVSGAVADSNGRYSLDGLCVMGEYTAAQEICGDGIDNDEDGEVDEVCQPIEACSSLSPGDDDGDGLVDSNDPDCPGTTNVCSLTGFTDPSVAGYCARFNKEGDNVSLLPAPGPTATMNQVEKFTILSELPTGITMLPNGVLSGTPSYTIRKNTDTPDTTVYNVLYRVRRETIGGAFISEFEQGFEWTIQNVNRPPVAQDFVATIKPGQTATFELSHQAGVNSTGPCVSPGPVDPDCEDTVTVTSVSAPAVGQVTSVGALYSWTAPLDFSGTVTYTYTIDDGNGGTDTGLVTINVINQPPVAVDDTVGPLVAGTPSASFNVLTMGTPDSDPDGDALSVIAFSQPGAGTVVHNGNGNFTWTPPTGYTGTTTFPYTISDGFGGTDSATVTIIVRNIPPIAVNDTATTSGTTPVTIAVMQNDSDPDNHVISVTGATTPPNGTAVVNANGTITYTANAGFEGVDTFFYTIRDGYGGESTATVTVTVGPPNRFDPCICATAKASPGEIWPPNHKQQVVTITNVSDPDGGPLDIKIIGIYQDEPTNYLGDGNTTIDGGGIGTSTAWVRAERTGNPNVPGNGRVYEIVFEATAADGSHCRGSVFTGVPHDQGQGSTIIDDGIRYDSTVAGGPIVRTPLKVQSGLSDAEVAALAFETKLLARAQYGDDSTRRTPAPVYPELAIGASASSFSASDHFDWTSGSPVTFQLAHVGNEVQFKLITDTQFVTVRRSIDCDNGECDDVLLRAQTGGEGTIRLSSLSLNGLPIAGDLEIDADGSAESMLLTGLSLSQGFTLSGIVTMTWTDTPSPDQLRFDVAVGSGCPPDGGSGGGGEGTPPLARNDAYTTVEDTPLPVNAAAGILINDLTFAGPLTASLESGTSNGTLTLNPDGSFLYTPNENFTGEDTFTYRVNDGNLFSEPAVVTITVTPVPDPPIAVDDNATTNENTPVTIAVTGNDSDPFGAALTIVSLTQPSNGTAVVSGTSIVYTPAAGFIGVDTFTYTIEGTEGTATATVTVTVLNVNEPPVAVNDAYTTAEDTPLTVPAPGVLVNDNDPDLGDALTVVLVSGPSNGTVTQNGDGSFVYTPAAHFNGVDSYTYRVRDAGGLESNIATVTITVTPVPDPPVAVDDSYVVAEDSVLTISAPGVKVNDSDPDTPLEDLVVTLVTGTQRGSLTLNADGSFIYTPFPDTFGSDSFVYRLSDGIGSSTATATIAITEVPDPPVAIDDAATTPENTPVTIPVLGNDSDPDTEVLTIVGVTQPSNGSVTVAGDQVVYTPAPGFSGQDTFTYTITDGQATATATVVVTVTAVNDPPVAQPDVYTTPRNTPLTVPAPGVMANDLDPDEGDTLTAVLDSQPANGSVVLQGDGSFIYTPETGFTGTDTFTYHVHDGTAESNVTTVTITVTAVNSPPIAVDDSAATTGTTPVSIDVLVNDSDPDGDVITVTEHTQPSNGSVTLTGGIFVYTANSGFTGIDTFVYTIADSSGATDTATVTITVSEVCQATGSAVAMVRRSATFHGGGVVDGSVQVMTAANVVFNAQTQVNGDLLIVGTPTVDEYPPVMYAGTQDGTGAAAPATHRVTIYGAARLGHVIRRTDAIAMPVVTNPPATTGTRNVQLYNPSDDPGDFATIRDLTVNSSAGTRTIPPGTYRNFTVNAPSTLVFGIPGATEPAIYNFETLTINSSSALTIVGPVVITVRNALNAYGSPLGNSEHPEWLTIRVASSNGFRLNSNVPLWGYVEAPNGPITIDGGAVLTGGIAADTFTLNGQGRLVLVAQGSGCEEEPVNQAPVAVDDAYTTPQGTPLTVDAAGVLANDSDPDGDAITPVLLSTVSNGTLTFNASGGFTYVPANGFSGVDTFTYRVSDGSLSSGVATVTITVTPVNQPPLAIDDSAETTGTNPVTIDVLGNDSDPDGDDITVTAFTQPGNGTVTQSGGTFVYTPAEGFTGTDTFTYTISDPSGATSTATVTIVVTASDVCEADGIALGLVRRSTMFDAGGRVEGSVQMMTAANATFNSNTVLVGDLLIAGMPSVQVNGEPAQYGGVVDGDGAVLPTGHVVTINAGASLGRILRRTNPVEMPVVAAPPSPSGSRSVTMDNPSSPIGDWATLRNLTLNNNIGPVVVPPGTYGTFIAGPNSSFVIGVEGAAEPAVYNFDTLRLNAGSSQLTVVGPVIVNLRHGATWHGPMGTEAHPEWLKVRVFSDQVQLDSQMQFHGELDAPNSHFIVNSGTLFKGRFAVDQFTVNSNGHVILLPGTCEDEDEEPNLPPVAVDDAYATDEDTPLTIAVPGILANDSDPEGASLVASQLTAPANGTVTVNGNGSFTYTPAPGFSGVDTFTYRVSDGTLWSNAATVTITVADVPAPPVANDDTATTSEDTPVTINVLGNDTDPDNDMLTVQSVTQPSNGTVTIVSGQVRYTPNEDFSGIDTFTYTISDGTATDTATVTVTVTAVNDPPVSVDDAYTMEGNTVLNQTTTVLVNDSDPEGDSLTARLVTSPSTGDVVFQNDGTFTYTPPNGFSGDVTFTYRANDGTADGNIATVTITVTPANDPPVAVNDSYTTDRNEPLTISAPGILANDSDPNDGDTLTAVLVSGTAGNTGSVTLNPDGSFTYTPAEDYTGTTTFRYRVRDNHGAESNEATVTIQVNFVPTTGSVCYDGGSNKTHLRAQIDWTVLENGDVTARAWVSRNYADNTYGVNRIGWGNKPHTFKHLYTSDFAQMAFYDKSGSKKIDFKIDYLSPVSGTPSGYATRGVTSGKQADGGMVSGSASDIIAISTSIDLNMNAFGYVTTASNHPLKSYSPPTNNSYVPNATYPLWIFDMWYEATIRASAFVANGFGTVKLLNLHASPAKEDVSTWRLINCQ